MLVSIDGPNGVGKSTVINQVVQDLTADGLKVHLTGEPSSGHIGRFIREYHDRITGDALTYLLAADRADHLKKDIEPRLLDHDIVITDRYVPSSIVLQQIDGSRLELIRTLNIDFRKPDLSILLTADAATIWQRLSQRGGKRTRFENKKDLEQEVAHYQNLPDTLTEWGYHWILRDTRAISVDELVKDISKEIKLLLYGKS